MINLKALIFDLDGVITDTIELQYLAWKRLAEEEGVEFTRQDNEALRGLTREDSLKYILKGRKLDPETAQSWMARKNLYFYEYLEHLTSANVLPGVKELLIEAKKAGLRIGIGSSSKNARAIITQLAMLDYFDAIGDGHAAVHPKPAPDIFHLVARQMAVLPSETVIFEDSAVGIQAALSGGFWTVGLGTEQVSNAHLVLPSLAGTSLSDIINYFNNGLLKPIK